MRILQVCVMLVSLYLKSTSQRCEGNVEPGRNSSAHVMTALGGVNIQEEISEQDRELEC